MITADKITTPLFTSWLDRLTFTITGDSAQVAVQVDGTTILSETYYPLATGEIEVYDLSQIIGDEVRDVVVGTVVIIITELQDGSTLSIWSSRPLTAYYSAADIDMSCENFLDHYFLTLLNGSKPTNLGRKEYLHAAGTDSTEATVLAQYYTADGNVEQRTFDVADTPAHTSRGVTTFNVSPDLYRDDTLGTLFAYTVTVGLRTQEYETDMRYPVCDPVLLFTNSFGCQELFYCTGTKKTSPEYERKTAVIGGYTRNYRIKETRKFEADTGVIPPALSEFCEDMLRSPRVYLYTDNSQGKEVTLSDSKSDRTNETDALLEYTFTYRYAQRMQNVVRFSATGKIFDTTFDDTFN